MRNVAGVGWRKAIPRIAHARVRFDARVMHCTHMLMTSLPAKRHVRVELDGTPYSANVTLNPIDYRSFPAIEEPK